MHGPWFHLEVIPDVGVVVALSRKETKHALGSRRLREGDGVVLFDGQGTRARGILVEERAGGHSLSIKIEARETVPPDTRHVELAASLPKGDRLATMLDMATQAGMNAFRPLECDESVVKASAMRSDRSERWARIMLEACKQSERAYAPSIASPLDPVLAARSAVAEGRAVLVAQQGGVPLHEAMRAIDGPVSVLIGPEAGFSEEELRGLGEAEATFASLGRAIYRIETAAVVAVAAIKSASG